MGIRKSGSIVANKKMLMAAVIGKEIEGNTTGWMDRKFGYTPKLMGSGSSKRQKPKRKK